MREMEQYISRKDLICWLLKQGTENGKLNISKTLSLDEIMQGINDLPTIKMADKEKLLEFGIWQMMNPNEKSIHDLEMLAELRNYLTKCNNGFRYEPMRMPTEKERESVKKYADSIAIELFG